MDLTLTPEVIKSFRDKDSKQERFRSLYEKQDFLTAYSQHTDLRMADDPKWAIGRGDEWEHHGNLQLNFLIKQGILPEHRLLDIGCGPGRAARRFVPYLNQGNYTGVDISMSCLNHARELAASEGWASKQPTFMLNADLNLDREFDFLWAHSVFTHLPAQQIEKMVGNAAKILSAGGMFCFTYKPALQPTRSGLKQFQYPTSFFEQCGSKHGLKAEALPVIWPASQRTFRLIKSAP